jgi:uncharacterized protein YndB with AHSA1/START domain
MASSEFVYTTYIKSTPQKVWNGITSPEFTRQYWNVELKSDWKKGSAWKSLSCDGGDCTMQGEILESAPPKRLVITWVRPEDAADKAEHSRVTFEIEAIKDMARLSVIHDRLKAGSVMADRIAQGWPRVLSSLKSMLETGKPLDTWAGHQWACEQQSDAKVAVNK